MWPMPDNHMLCYTFARENAVFCEVVIKGMEASSQGIVLHAQKLLHRVVVIEEKV